MKYVYGASNANDTSTIYGTFLECILHAKKEILRYEHYPPVAYGKRNRNSMSYARRHIVKKVDGEFIEYGMVFKDDECFFRFRPEDKITNREAKIINENL